MKNLLETPLGIEIETAVVSKNSFEISSVADKILEAINGEPSVEFVDGPITWSNELVNHVIEFKVSKPGVLSKEMADQFHTAMQKCNVIADRFSALLLPTGAHPFMDPKTQTQLWPGKYHEHYLAYHTVFNCYTHGFANLQSVHINIPFNTEAEFARLLAGIRLVLPLIPALAASSPFLEGKNTGFIDSRLEVYRTNQKKVASITGKIIPEQIYDFASYQAMLKGMYTDIAPYDKERILQTEQLNSRGCIARFDRNTLEIRLIDAQESPVVDIAVASAVVFILNELVLERWMPFEAQKIVSTDELYEILTAAIKDGELAIVSNEKYLEQFGITQPVKVQELLQIVLSPFIEQLQLQHSEFAQILQTILEKGPLARRMLKSCSLNPTREEIVQLYKKIAESYKNNKQLA